MFKFLCLAIFIAACAAFFSCGGDCKRSEDCGQGEVCYDQICQSAFSSFFENACTSDQDCDGDGDGRSNYYCELGRCRLTNTNIPVYPDATTSTVVDAGP